MKHSGQHQVWSLLSHGTPDSAMTQLIRRWSSVVVETRRISGLNRSPRIPVSRFVLDPQRFNSTRQDRRTPMEGTMTTLGRQWLRCLTFHERRGRGGGQGERLQYSCMIFSRPYTICRGHQNWRGAPNRTVEVFIPYELTKKCRKNSSTSVIHRGKEIDVIF